MKKIDVLAGTFADSWSRFIRDLIGIAVLKVETITRSKEASAQAPGHTKQHSSP
jgi:hypothetical protein